MLLPECLDDYVGWRGNEAWTSTPQGTGARQRKRRRNFQKNHSILKNQAGALTIENRIEETEVIEISDIIIIGFDETDTYQSQRFDRTKKTIFGFEAACQPTEKLCIEINVPQQWTPDADGNVYFEYITRAPGSLKMRSTVEIPEKLVQKWKFDISGIQHGGQKLGNAGNFD